MIVLDTNVLVSGLIAPSGPPAQLVRLVTGSRERIAFDQRILNEYRSVLSRPRLGIPTDEMEAILEAIEQDGMSVAASPLMIPLPDPDDLPFVEVAASSGAVSLVTGNLKHFPRSIIGNLGFDIVSPTAWLSRLARHHR